MGVKFTHYLITRYNVQLDQWETDLAGQSTRHPDWMQHRYRLFSRYCLPSVLAQSEKGFQWLIYFEKNTPADLLNPILNLTGVHPFIHVRLVEGYSGCKNDIDQQLTAAQTPYVITSRLDNDDGLGSNYIRTVQSHFVPQDKTLINLLHGHGYDTNHQVATRMINMQRNHFSSFIEERKPEGGHISVRGFQHGMPPQGTNIVNINMKASWLKIFHERNLLSEPFGYPVFSDDLSSYYGVEKKYLLHRFLPTSLYTLAWLPAGLYRRGKKLFSDMMKGRESKR